MSISDVQTLADSHHTPVALRTPLYLIISTFGLLLFVATFLPWAGVSAPSESGVVGQGASGDITSVSGLDAGGWGAAAIVVGLAIAVLGDLGYLWNPFSDPEAAFIAVFGAAASLAALLKILDPASLIVAAGDFESPEAGARIGLWLILVSGLVAFLGGLWILYSRPRAEARLT